ncbi:MAG: hypothetical protein ACREDM_00515 [Methylocella sp.]
MTTARYLWHFAAALAVASLAGVATDAQAKPGLPSHSHDGIYAVRVVTQHGPCYRVYNTKISVNGGQVRATGHVLMRAYGHIDPHGKVSLTLRALHHTAHVAGRMRGHLGSGDWSSPSLACSGYWHATRQS